MFLERCIPFRVAISYQRSTVMDLFHLGGIGVRIYLEYVRSSRGSGVPIGVCPRRLTEGDTSS